MPTINERHGTASPDVQEKLTASIKGAHVRQLRTIRCPCCGFYLLDIYGHDHCYIRVKCRKCKFDEIIDTALFRTINQIGQKRLKTYCEEIGKML